MQSEGHAGRVGQGIEDVDAFAEDASGIDAVFVEDVALGRRVNEDREFGGVDLDVLASEARQFSESPRESPRRRRQTTRKDRDRRRAIRPATRT